MDDKARDRILSEMAAKLTGWREPGERIRQALAKDDPEGAGCLALWLVLDGFAAA